MSRLVVVSNRVATIDDGQAAQGGLAVAVLASLEKAGGIWFGVEWRDKELPQSSSQYFRPQPVDVRDR